jgi:hypothetical protein
LDDTTSVKYLGYKLLKLFINSGASAYCCRYAPHLMNKPVLIHMCGLPFAGKTTLARGIIAQLGWHYVSLDAINTERGMGLDGKSIALEEYVLYVPTPEAEVRKRWKENRLKSQSGDVRDDDFALVVRQFEPPTPDECVIVYDPLVTTTSPDDFIAQILAGVPRLNMD